MGFFQWLKSGTEATKEKEAPPPSAPPRLFLSPRQAEHLASLQEENRRKLVESVTKFAPPLYRTLTKYPSRYHANHIEDFRARLSPFIDLLCEIRGEPACAALDEDRRTHPDLWPTEFLTRYPFDRLTEQDFEAVPLPSLRRFAIEALAEAVGVPEIRAFADPSFEVPEFFVKSHQLTYQREHEYRNRERKARGERETPFEPLSPEQLHELYFLASWSAGPTTFNRYLSELAKTLDRRATLGVQADGAHLVYGDPLDPGDPRSKDFPVRNAFECAVPYGDPLFRHAYIIGKTGSGKTTLMKSLIAQHIRNGQGVVVVSPENDLINEVIDYVPPERAEDVVYFDPTETKAPFVSLNPFAIQEGEQVFEKVGEVYAVLEHATGDLGESMKTLLNKCVYTLLERPGSCLQDLKRLLKPAPDFRQAVVADKRIHPDIREWWRDNYEAKSGYYKKSAEAVLNRLDAFFMPPLSSTLSRASFDLQREFNGQKRIFLFNLSRLKGLQAEATGQLILSMLLQTLLSRDKLPEAERPPYHLFIDEFQTYAGTNSKAFIEMFNRARKYRMSVTLAHQVTANIPGELLSTIIGNAGTVVCMQRPAEDAPFFARELQIRKPDEKAADGTALQDLPQHEFFLRTPANTRAVAVRTPLERLPKAVFPFKATFKGEDREEATRTIATPEQWRETIKSASRDLYGYEPKEEPDEAPEPDRPNAAAPPPPPSVEEDEDDEGSGWAS